MGATSEPNFTEHLGGPCRQAALKGPRVNFIRGAVLLLQMRACRLYTISFMCESAILPVDDKFSMHPLNCKSLSMPSFLVLHSDSLHASIFLLVHALFACKYSGVFVSARKDENVMMLLWRRVHACYCVHMVSKG